MTRPKTIIICDIDGVLADCEHRLKYQRMKDYNTFYGCAMAEDKKIEAGCKLLKMLTEYTREWRDIEVYFATGRPERTRAITKIWLEACARQYPEDNKLLMRKDGDYRPSPEVKAEQVWKILYPRDARNKSILEGLKDVIGDVLDSVASCFKPPEDEPEVWFIDDDPKNVEAVCRAYPFVQGIIFGTKRIRVENE